MSHYATLETKFVSEEHLVLALRDMGISEVECHKEAEPLVGWKGDSREARAEVIIRRKHLSGAGYDFGFARAADGRFEAMITDDDRRHYGNLWLGRLAQRYAYRVARDVLAKQGFDLVEESVSADRQIHLCVRRAA